MQILGIPVMRVAGVEADDVIGTVATRARADGFVVAVASPDKVSCYTTNLGHLIEAESGHKHRMCSGTACHFFFKRVPLL